MIRSAGLGMRNTKGAKGAFRPLVAALLTPEDIFRARKRTDLLTFLAHKISCGGEARGGAKPPFLRPNTRAFWIIKRGQMHGCGHAGGGHV
jgi:hypothetical protein